MHRRRAEELKVPTDTADNDDAAKAAAKEKNGGSSSSTATAKLSGGNGAIGAISSPSDGFDAKDLMQRPLTGTCSAPALLVVLGLLSLTVWSLPAPTFSEKISLLRQSWRLNAVLDESAQLKERIGGLAKEKSELNDAMEKEQARAVELQKRLGSSDGDAKSLNQELSAEQTKKNGLQGSNQKAQVTIDSERKKRRDLLHKLQAVKRAELKDLAVLDEGAQPVSVESTANKLQSSAAERVADKKMAGLQEREADKKLSGFLKEAAWLQRPAGLASTPSR